jgi:hypothetical protein
MLVSASAVACVQVHAGARILLDRLVKEKHRIRALTSALYVLRRDQPEGRKTLNTGKL